MRRSMSFSDIQASFDKLGLSFLDTKPQRNSLRVSPPGGVSPRNKPQKKVIIDNNIPMNKSKQISFCCLSDLMDSLIERKFNHFEPIDIREADDLVNFRLDKY